MVTDVLGDPLFGVLKKDALFFRYIQHSHPNLREWLVADYDEVFEPWIIEDVAKLPYPNYICYNPENSHAHLAWLLKTPVSFGQYSREGPRDFFEAVRRGFTKRLGSDTRYQGVLTKNPVHQDWKTNFIHEQPYELRELDDVLTKEDKAFTANEKIELGIGRNYDLFQKIRHFAYRESTIIKASGGTIDDLKAKVSNAANQMNLEFPVPLPYGEIRSTVKSVTNWTWSKYTGAGRSEVNTKRIRARWDRVNGREIGKPWLEMGISRATYYRRRDCIT